MIWERRLDSEGGNQALTSTALSAGTSTTSTIARPTTTTTSAGHAVSSVGKLHCPPASCPARYATTLPRRMMWPLREHRHIDSVYSYSPSRTTPLARSSTTFHLPSSAAHIAVTSATLTTKTTDVTGSHTVIL